MFSAGKMGSDYEYQNGFRNRDFVMAASGHKPSIVHDRYLNFTDRQLTDAFKIVMISPEDRRKLFTSRLHGKTVENANAASY